MQLTDKQRWQYDQANGILLDESPQEDTHIASGGRTRFVAHIEAEPLVIALRYLAARFLYP
jgi:hypothetical protein